MTKKIIIILLLISINQLIAKDFLYKGIQTNNQCYFVIGNENSIKIVDKDLNKILNFENVTAFDVFENKHFFVITNYTFLLFNDNLEKIYSKEIKVNKFFFNTNKLHGLRLFNENFIILPTEIPKVFNTKTHSFTNFYQLFFLNNKSLKFIDFDTLKINGNWLGYIENKTLNLLNSKSGNVLHHFIDGEYLSKIEKENNYLKLNVDNKFNYFFNLEKSKIEKIEKIERKDKNSIEFNHQFQKENYKIKIEILNTSVFSALSAWKKGKGNGKIKITDFKNKTIEEKGFEFSLQNLNNADFDIKNETPEVIIKLPKKDIVILKNKNFQIKEINKNINYCICNTQIYYLKNNKIQLFK